MAILKKKQAAQDPVKLSAADYERMGRELESLYMQVSPSRRLFITTAFVKGLMTGIGGVIGATVGIALLIWALSWFESIPLLGPFIDSIRSTIESY